MTGENHVDRVVIDAKPVVVKLVEKLLECFGRLVSGRNGETAGAIGCKVTEVPHYLGYDGTDQAGIGFFLLLLVFLPVFLFFI